MENESANPEDGLQLAADMRQIRAGRGLSFRDVAERTRLPEGVLEAFETNVLFDHPTFNQVYIRSVVRTYATAIDLPEDEALAALEQSLVGMYRGDLGSRYLGEAASPVDVPPPRVSTTRTISSAPTPSEIAHASTPPGSTGLFVRRTVVQRIATVVLVISLLLAGALLVRALLSSDDVDEPSADDAPVPVSAPPPPNEALSVTHGEPAYTPGDTLSAYIRSLGSPVRAIRIRVDRDLRRPYWIERDSSLVLRFAERIIVQEHDGLVEIDIPVIGYSSGRLRDGVPLVLTRARLEELVADEEASG